MNETQDPTPSGRRICAGHYLLTRMEDQPHAKAMVPQRLRDTARNLFFDWRPARMASADRAFGRDFYREDILRLASLLNRDLAMWLQ